MTELVKKNITPALSKDVDFAEKVDAVDSALKNRSAAQKNIKLKWAAVIKVLVKYNAQVPARRPDPTVAANLVNRITIYEPKDPRLTDKANEEKLAALKSDGVYDLDQFSKKRKLNKLFEAKFPGFSKYVDDLLVLADLNSKMPDIDKAATKNAKAELQKAVDNYCAAIEAYDETVESVANVKEYIGIVKDVAEISAIAQGQQRDNK